MGEGKMRVKSCRARCRALRGEEMWVPGRDPSVTVLLLHAYIAICDNGILAFNYVSSSALKNLQSCLAAQYRCPGSLEESGGRSRPLKSQTEKLDAFHKSFWAVDRAH